MAVKVQQHMQQQRQQLQVALWPAETPWHLRWLLH
jgi:hypothetical protein